MFLSRNDDGAWEEGDLRQRYPISSLEARILFNSIKTIVLQRKRFCFENLFSGMMMGLGKKRGYWPAFIPQEAYIVDDN